MLSLVSRYTGKIFLFIGVILFLFGFFAADLTSSINKEDFDLVIGNSVKEYAVEQCKINSEMKDCEVLLNSELEELNLEQSSFEGVTYDQYIDGIFGISVFTKWIRLVSIAMILSGIGLIFLGTLSLIGTVISAGFIIGLSSLLSYIFYKKEARDMINKGMQKIIEETGGISRVVAENLSQYFIGFVNISLNKTANLSLVIGLIGLIIGFALYFFKRKGLKK